MDQNQRGKSISSKKKVVSIKNQRLNKVVKIPTLNTAMLGNSRGVGANKGNSEQYMSSSSEDSKNKAHVNDIVFDPR